MHASNMVSLESWRRDLTLAGEHTARLRLDKSQEGQCRSAIKFEILLLQSLPCSECAALYPAYLLETAKW